MKKRMLKSLVAASLLMTNIWNGSLVQAEPYETMTETEEAIDPPASEESVTHQTTDSTTVEERSYSENEAAPNGLYGTVPWTWEKETQTIIFGEGEFPESSYNTNISYTIQYKNAKLLGEKRIKHLRFTKPVLANPNSSHLFKGLDSLESIENLNQLDTSTVTDMSHMFGGNYNLTSLDLSSFDTSKVTTMNNMLSTLYQLISLDVSGFDTSNVTDMGDMFSSSEKLTTLDVSNFNTSNVTNMSRMFYNARGLTSLDVSTFDTSKVTNMSGMFGTTFDLTSLDISNFNTSNVTNMSGMFYDANGFKQLDLSTFDTSKVTDMSRMFSYARELKTIDLSSFDTSNVTDMSRMFYDAISLDQLKLGKKSIFNDKAFLLEKQEYGYTRKWILSDVTPPHSYSSSKEFMTSYNGTRPGTYVREGSQHNGGTYGTVPWTWDNATRTLTFEGGEFPESTDTQNIQAATQQTGILEGKQIKQIKFTQPVKANPNSSYLFSGLDGLSVIGGLSNLDTSNVTDMSYMFYASGITGLDVSSFDTSEVLNMEGMFAGVHNLTGLDLSTFNTSKVQNMSTMFYMNPTLKKIDIRNFDTYNVTNMQNMFMGNFELESLDISSFNMSKVTSMEAMLASLPKVDHLTVGPKNIFNETVGLDSGGGSYTGRWILKDSKPLHIYSSSEEFIMNYDGSRPGTYFQEKAVPLTSVSLSPKKVELTVGTKQPLIPSFTPENATNKTVSYTSSNPEVASVSDKGIVKGLNVGTAEITVKTEDNGYTAKSQITVVEDRSLYLDYFYLGIDDYVTGEVDSSVGAKKVQLFVNGELITTASLSSSGSFELEHHGKITKTTDKVEVAALDRKNNELKRAQVTVAEKNIDLTLMPYTLYEDTEVTGKADYYHTHVSLVINGDVIEKKILASSRQFSFNTEGLIDYEDDDVEVIGYRYDQELSKQKLSVQLPKIEMNLLPYTLDTLYVKGTVKGKSASAVRLFVNRKRQQTVNISEDGSFNLLGVAIQSLNDKVEIAVLNEAGTEIRRFAVILNH